MQEWRDLKTPFPTEASHLGYSILQFGIAAMVGEEA